MQVTDRNRTIFFVSGALILGIHCTLALGQDRPNLAVSSAWPRGKGLATAFVSDQGISSHPAVIFADNFEDGQFRDKWDSCRDDKNEVLRLVNDAKNDQRVGQNNKTNIVYFDNVVIASKDIGPTGITKQ